MFRRIRRPAKHVVAAIAVLALAAPATASEYQDLRNPDSVGRAIEARRVPSRDGATPPPAAPVTLDSPDRFDWRDAGIGAGGMLGLLLIALSVTFAVVHRRNRPAST
jgi:hypothetical protein